MLFAEYGLVMMQGLFEAHEDAEEKNVGAASTVLAYGKIRYDIFTYLYTFIVASYCAAVLLC